MKIGVDFGTSFSSAAVCIDGQVHAIHFGHEPQFRTAVFFPDRYVDVSQFFLSAEYEHEIAAAIRSYVSRFNLQLREYRERLSSLAREEKRSAREGKPYAPEQKAERRQYLFEPKRLTDEEVRQGTINAIRRRWISEQRSSIAQEALDVRQASGVFGEDAIEALYNNEEGRIFQSPKSMLGYRLEPRHRDVVVGVIAQVLAHIRVTAARQLDEEVTDVVLGRPVEFRGVAGLGNDQTTQDLLELAAREAGFAGVEFLMEPAAAALGYHRESTRTHAALIIDIGGGTSDIAYAHVGGDAAQPVIHQVWGKGFGGTDVDVELSVSAAMPLFGKDQQHGLPLHAYRSAAKISDLSLQQAFIKLSTARVIEPFKTRLERLKAKGTTVRLNRDIERLKIELSTERSARVSLGYIEQDLYANAGSEVLASSTRRFIQDLHTLLEQVRAELPETVPVVFMTGGMSRAPYVQACVKALFSESEIVMGDASLGVVTGLAQFAAAHGTSVKPAPIHEVICVERQQRLLRQREWFQLQMARADEVAEAYEKQGAVFQRQYEVQKKIFAGTDIGKYLDQLSDCVCNAYEFNEEAGWLPSGKKFTEFEYFERMVKQDWSGRRFKSLANVPELLREEFEDDSNEDFQRYANELREACRTAYEEMAVVHEDLDEEQHEDSIFDAFYAWPEEANESAYVTKQAHALIDNLREGWLSCKKAGLKLLHMANHRGDDDYDASLMTEIFES